MAATSSGRDLLRSRIPLTVITGFLGSGKHRFIGQRSKGSYQNGALGCYHYARITVIQRTIQQGLGPGPGFALIF